MQSVLSEGLLKKDEEGFGIAPLLSPRGWGILILFLTVMGGLLRIRPLLIIAFILAAAVALAWLWNRYALRGVRYRRTFSQVRVFPDETLEVSVYAENGKPLPLTWLLTYDNWPKGVTLEQGGKLLNLPGWGSRMLFNTCSPGRYEQVAWRYTLRSRKRGIYPFGPVTIHSGDPFGLFRQERTDKETDRLIVYPLLFPLEALGLPPKEPIGEIRTQGWLFQDPSRTVGIRDYQPGDSFRHVHWKASARRRELQTRVYEPTVTLSMVVFLNVATHADHWRGAEEDVLEWAISVAGSLARYGIERRMAVGLASNGAVYRSDQPLRVLPGRSADQLMWILEGLAGVSGYATQPIEEMLWVESARLRWGATLVVVTAVMTDALRATLMRLKEAGRRLVVIHLGPATLKGLEGITTIQLPLPPSGLLPQDSPLIVQGSTS
jgi:uncharacterized protein (DUF58 family)